MFLTEKQGYNNKLDNDIVRQNKLHTRNNGRKKSTGMCYTTGKRNFLVYAITVGEIKYTVWEKSLIFFT
jgi:hypothetical protein